MAKKEKWNKKKIIGLSPSEIGKMNRPQMLNLIKQAREIFDKQENKFNKYKSTVFSPSLEWMKDYYSENRDKLNKMSLNKLRAEAFRLQNFFDSKTSTVPGARAIQRDQDKRIFGTKKNGVPKERLTIDERKEFWSIYNEYKQINPADVLETSNIVQQILGEMIIQNDKLNRAEFLKEARERFYQYRHRYNWEMDEIDDL